MSNYIKTFQDKDAYLKYEDSGTMLKPNVSYAVKENVVYFTKQAGSIISNGDLSRYDIYGKEIARTTANCYIVRKAGTYSFPLVYGNALYKGADNKAAYTNKSSNPDMDFVNHLGNKITSPYIEKHNGCMVDSIEVSETDNNTIGFISNCNVTDKVEDDLRFLTFTVGAIPDRGANAIISIKDANGKYIWSWHIWCIPENVDIDPVTLWNGNSAYNILPYNLGSTFYTGENATYAITDGDKTRNLRNFGECLLYQFGRKDPFFYNGSHSKVAIPTDGTVRTTTIADGIANARTFYCMIAADTGVTDGAYDWNSLHPYNLWDATQINASVVEHIPQKTIYDPSPIGFCVEPRHAFYGFTTSSGGSFGANIYYNPVSGNTPTGTEANVNAIKANSGLTLSDDYLSRKPVGYRFKRSANDSGSIVPNDQEGILFSATGYLTADGFRSSRGNSGNYWSCAPFSRGYAYYLGFGSRVVYPQNGNYRAYGCAVRAVQELSF